MSKAWRVFILRVLSVTVSLMGSTPSYGASDSKGAAQGALVLVPAFTNMDEIAKNLKVARFKGKKFERKIKVAVLDIGFSGWQEEIGKRLPKDTVYHSSASSEADKIASEPFHGLFMAELISEIIQKSGAEADYELHLFNAYGITKLTDAIDTVIRDQFDLVLYAQVWEYGGNGDGLGFINALVDKAVKAGVIWINAAGDFGRLSRKGPVQTKTEGSDEWVYFTDEDGKGKEKDGVSITCRVPPGQTCSLRMVLSWNDFKDDISTGTDRDLDLYLYDSNKKQVGISEKNQAINPDENDTKASRIPRELIEATLKTGTYKARVKVKSKNFSADTDDLRITASGIGIDMVDPTITETILPPADNPGVIVIGASDDVNSNRSKELGVPHVFLKSTVKLKDGGMLFSTSGASAMATGLATLQLGTGTEKSRDAVLEALKEVSRKEDQDVRGGAGAGAAIPTTEDGKARPDDGGGRGRSSGSRRVYLPPQRPAPYGYNNGYGGAPNGGGLQPTCATPINQQPAHQLAQRLLSTPGAMMVNFSGHQAIRIRYPQWARMNLGRRTPNRIPVLTPQGIQITSFQYVMNGLPAYNYEIITDEVPFCGQGY